jgi:hypothetical protein
MRERDDAWSSHSSQVSQMQVACFAPESEWQVVVDANCSLRWLARCLLLPTPFFSFPDIVCLYIVVARDDVCFIY